MAMPSTDARTLPATARARRWSLAAAIASVTVFGLSIGQGAPLLSLLLEAARHRRDAEWPERRRNLHRRHVGPLLAPRLVRRFGIRNFLLVCFGLDIALFLAMKPLDGLAAWFVLRPVGAVVGSSIFTSGEAWINQLAGDAGRGRVHRDLCGRAVRRLRHRSADPVDHRHRWLAAPSWPTPPSPRWRRCRCSASAEPRHGFDGERGASPLRMFVRAPIIVATVAVFGLYESALMSLLPIWGVRSGMTERWAAATLSAVYFGAIMLQVPIGWLSDRASRPAALLLCGAVGLAGAIALVGMPALSPALFGLLFVWGGVASGIYPVALSMAGDRFRGGELVSVNAAMIMAYGLGGLAGPAMGGVAMDLDDRQGLPWLFAGLFAGLLAVSLLAASVRRRHARAVR